MTNSTLLHNIFDEAVRNFPDHIAIDVPGKEKLSYKELDFKVNALARELSRFVKEECVIAIMLPRDSHLVYMAQLAVLKAGAAYTCIDTSFPSERARFIAEDSGAVCVITEAKYLNLFGCPKIDIHEWDRKEEKLENFESPSWLTEKNLAYVIYTSGTTGKPKGVMIEHRNVVNLVLSDRDYFQLPSDYRMVQTSSTSYDSSVEEIWLPFGVGATLVVGDDEVVRLGPDFGPWLRDNKINVLCPPPTLLRMGICADPKKDLPDLKLVYVGGEPLPPEVVEAWAPGRHLENGYGPTECTITVTRTRIYEGRAITIGKPVRNNFGYVLDENLHEVEKGKEGELCIGGAGVARGYLNREELTKEKFIEHPSLGRLYRTGDLVKILPDDDIAYLGRIDLQVKLRGYRIELGDVESALMDCDGVKDAACKVQDMRTGQTLVAYLIPKHNTKLDFDHVRVKIKETLPHYMVPAHFRELDRLPISPSSGKLNRKALPDIEEGGFERSGDYVAPKTDIEKLLVALLKKSLHLNFDPSMDDNFFEIGGDSLGAAIFISELRNFDETKHITVRDLYENPTVEKLAMIKSLDETKSEKIEINYDVKSSDHAILVSIFQLIWILTGIIAGATVGYFMFFHIAPFLLHYMGLIPFVLFLPLLLTPLYFLYVPFSILLSLLVKKILIGTYKPGRHPVWGSMYLRNWIVSQTVRLVPMNSLEGTEFKNMFFRLLGVKIGKNVTIEKDAHVLMGGWDLLEIGDNVTIGREANLRTLDYFHGEMVFGSIKIGNDCTLETRASMSLNSEMKENSKLTGLSMLAQGDTLPKDEVWEGVPAKFKHKREPIPTDLIEDGEEPFENGLSLIAYRTLMGLATRLPVPVALLGAICYWDLDAKAIINWLHTFGMENSLLLLFCAYSILTPALSLPLQALFARWIGQVKPGYYSRYSKTYILIWLKDRMVELAGNALSGTLFWPHWLRLAGMKVGKNCEISTIIDVVPELVTIEDEVFFADGIYLGGPLVDRNVVYCDEIKISSNTFIGNHAIIPPGSLLPPDILLGICTVADKEKITEGTSWFGHPAFRLPKREVVECSRELTHNPSWYRYLTRLFWESLRFCLPVVPTLFFLAWLRCTYFFASTQSNFMFFGLTLPLISIGLLLTMSSLIFVIKWSLLGKVKEGIHPFWSCWCGRWDFLYVAWAAYARKFLVFFEGTLFLGWWLRLMGSKVGKRVVLGHGFAQVVDPDMLHFEDHATVLCLFQAHSFEDRVLKIAPVHIKKHSTVGNSAVLLYGAEIGEGAYVADNSVVMKREKLLSGNSYSGAPTRPL